LGSFLSRSSYSSFDNWPSSCLKRFIARKNDLMRGQVVVLFYINCFLDFG
jgi:hypothetical protein